MSPLILTSSFEKHGEHLSFQNIADCMPFLSVAYETAKIISFEN